MSACGKCMRPGPITSNGYLNFLRMYRKKCCGLSPKETVRRGAKAWNRLTCEQKARFRRMGNKRRRSRCKKKRKRRKSCKKRRKRRRSRCAKKKRRRSRCAKKRRRRSRCAKKRRRRAKCGKKKCMRPGRITNNAYLNFLRWYRQCHCGLSPQETVRRGARKWCSLPAAEKKKFNRKGGSKRRRKSSCKKRRKRRC